MTLAELIDAIEAPSRTITVLNRRQPDPVYEMVADFFEPMALEVQEARLDVDEPADAVVLHEEGTPIAVSPLPDLYRSVFGVNVDRYATGTGGLAEMDLPDVVTELGDVPIPGDAANKFVLIQVSRYVEAMAYKTGGGELHAGFQRLSRLGGERGTRRVYCELGEAGVDVHVYGRSDRRPSDLPVTVRADASDLRDYWIVAHDGDGNDGWKAALVAEEVAENAYRGFWTFDPGRVDEVLSSVTGAVPPEEK
ncbi:histidine kinase [Halobacteriales archaeon QS_1_68_20]|nr:MAG: histidine kinase [Halobacteriales archaeon QS_1_68_20]